TRTPAAAGSFGLFAGLYALADGQLLAASTDSTMTFETTWLVRWPGFCDHARGCITRLARSRIRSTSS
ncbi:hypothetical protein EDM76_10340, partial [bacterium]